MFLCDFLDMEEVTEGKISLANILLGLSFVDLKLFDHFVLDYI